MSPAAPDGGMPYRLDELGWLQFEQLCKLIVEIDGNVPELRWRGRADQLCQAFIGGDEMLLKTVGLRVGGPVTLAVLWVPVDATAPARHEELGERIATLVSEAGSGAGAMVVLTNLSLDLGRRPGTRRSPYPRHITLLGPTELGRCLDGRPQLRFAMPSVLGLRDLGALLDSNVTARSSLDIEAAQELARVFVPTHSYARACEVLRRHRFVVLTGPPEMGKTAIARMIALAALTDRWEAHECTRPEQVWQVFDRERRQVFVADDAFGSTEYQPEIAELWARELGRMLAKLDERHWLIWTSRPAPLRAGLARVQRERGSERFPAPGEVLVDASELDLAEKTLILFRHAKHRGEGADTVRAAGESIVEHPHFTPERIRRFVSERLPEFSAVKSSESLRDAVQRELATPTDAMRTSFSALGEEHRAVLIALLDVPAGLVDQRELIAAVRRHHPGGLSRPPDQLVDRLTDHFLRVGTLGIGWVHPSWRDLVIAELGSDTPARERFLKHCGLYGAMLGLSTEGGARGERTLPLLVRDSDWDLLTDTVARLLRELDEHQLGHLLHASLTAMKAAISAPQKHELESVAIYELSALRRRWDTDARPVPVFLIEAWFELDDYVEEAQEPPKLAPTWAELHPGVLDPAGPYADLARADDWLSLAETLASYAPRSLSALGFPHRDTVTLRRLIDLAAARSTRDGGSRDLGERVLRRILRLAPDRASGSLGALRSLQVAAIRDQRWWVPGDLPAPPTTELATQVTSFSRSDIGRVLEDL